MSTPLRTISHSDLQVILADHRFWISSGGTQGKRADLSGAYLSYANLYGANLEGANLSGAYLSRANLEGADLYRADLRSANLIGANLACAYLSRANLSYADLSGANLEGANLMDANLEGANLSGAKLSGAKLSGANLSGIKDLPDFQRCPQEGASFKAFKKVWNGSMEYVLELEVPADAKRVSSTGIKCRCSRAKVLRAMNLDGSDVEGVDGMVFQSFRARNNGFSFPYQVDQEVSVEDFDGDIRVECAKGIHFFMEFEEAKNYRY